MGRKALASAYRTNDDGDGDEDWYEGRKERKIDEDVGGDN